VQKAARWPCSVCGRGVGSNSIQCTSYQKWVHKKCSGIKGSMYKVMQSFICRGCSNPVIRGCSSVDIGASANQEVVEKFCYLGDMLSVDGDADAAVEAKIRIGWNKFRQLNLFHPIRILASTTTSLPHTPHGHLTAFCTGIRCSPLIMGDRL